MQGGFIVNRIKAGGTDSTDADIRVTYELSIDIGSFLASLCPKHTQTELLLPHMQSLLAFKAYMDNNRLESRNAPMASSGSNASPLVIEDIGKQSLSLKSDPLSSPAPSSNSAPLPSSSSSSPPSTSVVSSPTVRLTASTDHAQPAANAVEGTSNVSFVMKPLSISQEYLATANEASKLRHVALRCSSVLTSLVASIVLPCATL
jgi:hypothetical protein